jgi:phage shock protein PspC (stress-responsive transcriptional regulator)
MILGVCDWLSHKLNYEAKMIRIAFIIFALLGGSGILLYLILFVVMLLEKK